MPCDVGQTCAARWDCRTSNCTGNTCQQLLTCTNGVKDTTEGDVDCGWLCGRQCGVGATCRVAGDCISSVCTSGRCADAPTCTNNKMDGKETGERDGLWQQSMGCLTREQPAELGRKLQTACTTTFWTAACVLLLPGCVGATHVGRH